jgi:hypothetical protein
MSAAAFVDVTRGSQESRFLAKVWKTCGGLCLVDTVERFR